MPKYSIVITPEEASDQIKEVWSLVKGGLSKYGQVALTLDKQDSRTLAQNRKLWPMLQDVSKQVEWSGQHPTPEEWKHIFTASLKSQKCYPGLEGGLVFCGFSTSSMSKKMFSDLLEVMFSFGAENGVVWSDPDIVSMYNEYVIKESGND